MPFSLKGETEAKKWILDRWGPRKFANLEGFADALISECARQNLISRSTIDQVWLRHIADSAQLSDLVSYGTGKWLDIGSGAGFPGLIIAMLNPNRQVVLCENRSLRHAWLNRMIVDLGLDNCRVWSSSITSVPSEPVHVISGRAFASLAKIIQVAAPFSTMQTEWVLPRGRSARQEVATLPSEFASVFHVKQSITDEEAGIVVGRGALR